MVAHVHSEVLVNGHEDAFEIYVPLAQPGAICHDIVRRRRILGDSLALVCTTAWSVM